jgi:hypothetical protein
MIQLIPKIIWTYWHDDNPPLLIEKCIETWRFHNPDYKIHVLSENTFMKYCKYDIKSHKHYDPNKQPLVADMIRLDLLKNYGGVWMDASIICLKPIKFNDTTSCFMYYMPNKLGTLIGKFPAIENWFIACTKHNEFITKWFDEFVINTNNYNSMGDYKNYNIFNGNDKLFNFMSNYYSMHSAAQVIINEYKNNKNPKITLINASSPGAPYGETNLFIDSKKNNTEKCKDFKLVKSPFLKLNGLHRYELMKKENLSLLNCVFKKYENFGDVVYMNNFGNNDDLNRHIISDYEYPYTHTNSTNVSLLIIIFGSICLVIIFILLIIISVFCYKKYIV